MSTASGNDSVPKHNNVYPNFSLRDRVYIVTGGGRGMGLAMAEAMTEAGADVHCFDRLLEPDEDFVATQELAKRAHVGSLHYHHVDVRQTQYLDDTIGKVMRHRNRLDGLVAAAGVQQIKDAIDYTAEEVTEMMDINFTGVFMTARAVGGQMIDKGFKGSIVLIASMSGIIANKGLICPVYNSSKAAVMQLSRSLAMEWGPKGIRVNSLCPGYVVTPMVQDHLNENPELRKMWESESMLNRLGQPEDFTGAAIFLLSDSSNYMTGSSLMIDGGHTAW